MRPVATPRGGAAPAWAALLAGLLAAGCAAPRPVAIEGAAGPRSEGAALAWGLFADNAAVDAAISLKSVSPATAELVREIAAESRRIASLLEAMALRESLPLDSAGLPEAEVAVRRRLREQATWELLAGRGERFERRLLLSQVEALSYGAALLGWLASNAPDSADAASIRAGADTVAALRQRAIDRLAPAP
jgi:hypothetical protein